MRLRLNVSLIAMSLVVGLSTACVSGKKPIGKGLTFQPPEDEFVVSGEVLSRAKIYSEWSDAVLKENPKLYSAIQGAVELSKTEHMLVHINRTDTGNYYLTAFTTYDYNHVLSITNNEVMFDHYGPRDGPSVEISILKNKNRF